MGAAALIILVVAVIVLGWKRPPGSG